MSKPNYEDYEKYVDRYGMTEKEQRAFIEAVWKLVEAYAEEVFGNTPTIGESNK